MAKRYKLTLENVALAVEQCPYVACRGPYWDDYEIMPSKEFLAWVDENADHYGLNVYRKPDEAFFRVEVVPNDQNGFLGWPWLKYCGNLFSSIYHRFGN